MRFKCSYAYDVPHYFDFTVEAATEEEAQQMIERALKDKVFDAHDDAAQPCYDNADGARVFVSGESDDTEPFSEPTLEGLTAEHQQANGVQP